MASENMRHLESLEAEEAPRISADLIRNMKNDCNDEKSSMPPPHKISKDDVQKDGLYSSERLYEQAQSLINEINAKRKNDTVLLENFKTTMDEKIQLCSSNLEKVFFQNYEANGALMQEKLQDLYATLDRINKLEQELMQFRNALGLLYKDVTAN